MHMVYFVQAHSNSDDNIDLVLGNVTMADAGEYTCVVQNNIGNNYRSAWLKIINATTNVSLEGQLRRPKISVLI